MPWDQVMHKWKTGALKSGGSGKPVQSQAQAVAIMLSEKRKAGSNPEYRAQHHAGTTNVGLALFKAMAKSKNRNPSRG